MGQRRNAACPCGSGRKYKHCCLADEQRAVLEARLDDAVGRRIQDWSSDAFDGEIGVALDEFLARRRRSMSDADIQFFETWFHNDRELPGGGTPAERYAARPDLPDAERDAAARIAAAELGVYRVVAVEPGRSLTLEGLDGGECCTVRSPHVSREATRWDLALGRIMRGDPPTLWGPTRFFEPCEEPELRNELALLADSPPGAQALALMRYVPPSRPAEPMFYTRVPRGLDEPHPLFDGLAPHVALAVAGLADALWLLRQIEDGADRARRRGDELAA